MSYRPYFQHCLRRRYPVEQGAMLSEIEARYQAIAPDVAFARRSANPMDRRLDFSAYFLATILVLEKRGENFAQIRETCLAITKEMLRPKNALQAWLKRLPVLFIASPLGWLLTRFMEKKTTKLGHSDGFRVRMVTDPALTHGLGYGVDILECGICKLYHKHGAGRYASILCEVDKLTASLAGLEMFRNGTIANGAPCCDFRWKRLG